MAKDPYRYFRIEAQELVQGLAEGLLELDKGADAEVVKRMLRFAHTFKGAARVVRRADIGDLAHRIEDDRRFQQGRHGDDARTRKRAPHDW